jgi:hypothetical protein
MKIRSAMFPAVLMRKEWLAVVLMGGLLFCEDTWKETIDSLFAVAKPERVQYLGIWNYGIAGSNFAWCMNAYIIMCVYIVTYMYI